jgi:hypothetical protein
MNGDTPAKKLIGLAHAELSSTVESISEWMMWNDMGLAVSGPRHSQHLCEWEIAPSSVETPGDSVGPR